jgi:hypothetical protein
MNMDRHSQQLVIGILFLAGAALQLGTGKALYKRSVVKGSINYSPFAAYSLCRRAQNPRSFWFAVALTTLVGAIAIWASVYS